MMNPWVILGVVLLLGATHSTAFYKGAKWEEARAIAATTAAKETKTEKKDEIRNRALDYDDFVKCLRAHKFGKCFA